VVGRYAWIDSGPQLLWQVFGWTPHASRSTSVEWRPFSVQPHGSIERTTCSVQNIASVQTSVKGKVVDESLPEKKRPISSGLFVEAIMLQLENPIREIEWSGDTRGNGKVDSWELHTLIVGAALEWCKPSREIGCL